MMTSKIRNIVGSAVGLLAATGPASAEDKTEQPKYDVIKHSDGVELRHYAPQLVAEVTIEAGSIGQASSKGFGLLAGYIFGGNQGAAQIRMTAPVTTRSKSDGTKIAMTAPVTTSENEDGVYTVRFSMPAKWTMATLPKPNDDKVELIQIEAEERVAYRLVGDRSPARIEKAAAKIDAFLKAEKLETMSPMIIAGYDGPSVPTESKRWEVMRVVK